MKELQISSSHNPRLRAAIQLKDSRARLQTGRFLIDGRREIARALRAGIHVVEWYSTFNAEQGRAWLAEWDLLPRGVDSLWITLPETLMSQLTYGERRADLVAVATMPNAPAGPWPVSETPFLAVVDGIEKPGNLGAMLRTACAAGVDAFFMTNPVSDLYNPNAIRSSTGAVFDVPVYNATAESLLSFFQTHGVQILAARVDAEQNYDQYDLRGPTALVLGSEAHGLGDAWQHPSVHPLRLPMQGVVDSLNVSVTAAILFYEVRRQRGFLATSPPASARSRQTNLPPSPKD